MFDAITLAAVADELEENIVRGRVQDIVQLDALSFGFEIYARRARHYLYLTAHPEDARVHLVRTKLRASGEPPSALLLLLRKYAEGAFISSIAPIPNERVLKVQFDHSTEGISTLVVETIGRYSNLVLLDASEMVVDALKRVGADVNRARVILPGRPYAPPPPQNKLEPTSLTSAVLQSELRKYGNIPLWQALVKTIAGTSPLLAREIAHRVPPGSSEPVRAVHIIEALKVLENPPWHPTVAYEDAEPAEYAPYELLQYPTRRAFDSISAAIEAFYGALDSYAAAKEPLRRALAEARDRLARKRASLARSLPSADEIERLRTSGELVLAYASQIEAGQRILRAEAETGVVEIPLNPQLSAVANAQRYFEEYHRAKSAATRVPALLEEASAQVDYAEQMLNDLELAENRAEIESVIESAREAGLINQTRRRRASKHPAGLGEPRVVQSRDGFTILIGKNARQNELVTFRRAKPDDLWLHAQNVAGAHVVIVRAGRAIPESTIQEAAGLAAHYSQARGEGRVDVIVAPRKNVHRRRGGKPGMVTVRDGRLVAWSTSLNPDSATT